MLRGGQGLASPLSPAISVLHSTTRAFRGHAIQSNDSLRERGRAFALLVLAVAKDGRNSRFRFLVLQSRACTARAARALTPGLVIGQQASACSRHKWSLDERLRFNAPSQVDMKILLSCLLLRTPPCEHLVPSRNPAVTSSLHIARSSSLTSTRGGKCTSAAHSHSRPPRRRRQLRKLCVVRCELQQDGADTGGAPKNRQGSHNLKPSSEPSAAASRPWSTCLPPPG